MKAGFIGLGTMGASMAANCKRASKDAATRVVVHDIRREAAAPHIKNGAVWADTPAAVAAAVRGDLHLAARAAGVRGGVVRRDGLLSGDPARARRIST